MGDIDVLFPFRFLFYFIFQKLKGGFLNGSGLLLIHQDNLWQIMDEWLAHLEAERFTEILPVLRLFSS